MQWEETFVLMPFTIRPASSADLAALVALERGAFAEPWSEKSLAEGIGTPRWVTLVAEAADGICGYGVAWLVGDEGELARLAVAPMARRTGVGRALTRALIAECGRRGVANLFLEVRASNIAARNLYEQVQFTPCGRRRNYYSNGEDAILMQLRMTPC